MSNATEIEAWNLIRRQETRERVAVHRLINFDDVPLVPVKVSVIVPVCNVEAYLSECLESILAQSLTSIEVICVNDGSPDNSIAILEEFALRDHRVKVVDKDNAGYGHTMNIGMDLAQGEYIAIVESDDYIRPGMLESLYAVAVLNDLDFVKSDFYRFTSGRLATRLFYHALTTKGELYNRVLHPLDDPLLFRFTNTWTGLYRKSFLDEFGIRHQESPGASYQDNGFWFLTTATARRFMYIETPFYMNRRDNPNSSVFNDAKLYAGNSEYSYIQASLERFPELYGIFRDHLLKKKFDTYRYNYARVSPELKYEYLLACAEEFRVALGDTPLAEEASELMTLSDVKALNQIAFDPLGFHAVHRESSLGSFDGSQAIGTIPIVMITDENYALPAGVAITSMVKSKSPSSKYQITVVADRVSDENIKRFASLASVGVEIQVLDLNASVLIDQLESSHTDFGVPSTALLKFWLPSILESVDKVLYIDDDVLVRKDLSELYSTNLGKNLVGAVSDIPQVLYDTQSFGVEHGVDYFNSGVLLLNLSQMREEGSQDALIEAKGRSESRFMDQDVLNAVLAGRVLQLSIRYNALVLNLVRSAGRYSLGAINSRYGTNYRSISDILDDSVIAHFCSPDKPWKYYDVPFADEWVAAHAHSPFSDVRIRRLALSEKDSAPPVNGFYSVATAEEVSISAVVLKANRVDYTRVSAIVNAIDAKARANTVTHVHVLNTSLGRGEIEYLQSLSTGAVEVRVRNIKRLIERDRAKGRGVSLPDEYYRFLVPEILSEYNRVLVVAGANLLEPVTLTDEVFGADAEIALSPLSGGGLGALQVGALAYQVQPLLRRGLKNRYLSLLREGTRKKFGPAGAAQRLLADIPHVGLYSESLESESHNRAISNESLRERLALLERRSKAADSTDMSPLAARGEDIAALVGAIEDARIVNMARVLRALDSPHGVRTQATSGAQRGQARSPRNSQDGPDLTAPDQLRTFEDGVSKVRASASYRIGRVFTFLPGAVRRALK